MPPLKNSDTYSVRAATGILGAALVANASIFGMRLATNSLKRAYITRIQAQFAATVAFTAGSQQLFVAERFSGAAMTGGLAFAPMKHGSLADASDVTDSRVSATGLLSTTSVVFEGQSVPLLGMASPAASQVVQGLFLDLRDDPIRLLPGEGLCIRNSVLWPAAGTGILTAHISWHER